MVAFGSKGTVGEGQASGEVFVTVLLDVLWLLLLVLVGDSFLKDERNHELLVIGRIDGISDYVGTIEEMRIKAGEWQRPNILLRLKAEESRGEDDTSMCAVTPGLE